MNSFIYEALPTRVVFGVGTIAQLKQEVDRLGLRRPLVLSTPQQRSQAKDIELRLDRASAGIFDGAEMHTPVEVTERALAIVRERAADGIIAVGGGSTTGLSKAIAARTGLPQIVLPTTYAGSEMTPILGETKDGLKTTRRDPKILPNVVIYDVDLTVSLPAALSATSGINALAHAAEALYGQNTNPITLLMAEEGIAALGRSLPRIVADPTDREARSDALYGAWLCGICLGTAGMALHHKLCHTLGGSFNLPHAETHTIVLPHVIAFNAPNAPDAMNRIARALGANDAIAGLNALLDQLNVVSALRDIGMPEDGIEKAADLAVANPYWNPRPIERSAILDLIRRAWAGEPASGTV